MYTHLNRAPEHAQHPQHPLKAAVLLFCLGDGAGACGEDPLLHHCQNLGPLLQLLHQHVLHVHQPGQEEPMLIYHGYGCV